MAKSKIAAMVNTVVSAAPVQMILDPSDPMQSARELVNRKFTVDGARTIHRHRGAFWVWTGAHYRLAEDETIRGYIWNFLDMARVIAPKNKAVLLPFNPTKPKVENVFAALTAVCALDDQVEPAAWLLLEMEKRYPACELYSCASGLLHLPTREMIPHSPSYFGLSSSEVVYDPKAPQPERWTAWLKEAVVDEEAIGALQEAVGYMLSSDTSQQKIILGVGARRCGKGTAIHVVTKLVGSSSVTGPTMSDLSGEFGLQPLIKSPLAVIADARIGARTDKAKVTERLLSISGEDCLTVNRKNKLQWTGRLPTRLWIMTNDLPALSDTSSALAGRFIIIAFPNSFYGREDTKLKVKLDAELSGILNWAIEGYRRLNERGSFVQPKNALDIMGELETLGSPIRAFLRDCCVVGAEHEAKSDILFNAYLAWAEKNRQRATNKEWFGRELRSALPGVSIYRPRKPGDPEGRDTYYRGVGISTVM